MKKIKGLRLDISGTETFITPPEVEALAPRVSVAAGELAGGTGPGADFLGWRDLPPSWSEDRLAALEESVAKARQDCEVFVVIGIGGSYLGARAVLEALGGDQGGPEVLFTGTGLCPAAFKDLLRRLRNRELRLCVISKSGTTLEPAIAFRFLREIMQERYGREEAARRITAITDARKGVLRQLAEAEDYETFVIPDDVGGRFSVLTPVGLLPLAVAGVDVRALVAGAGAMREACQATELRDNPAHLYAATRYALYEHGYRTEILSTFDSRLPYVQEWWKQLFGESEGKDGRGIFPAAALFTTDLHSLGQYVQDGRRELLETFLCVQQSAPELAVPAVAEITPAAADDATGQEAPAKPGEGAISDGLDYLVGTSLDEINWRAYEGTRRAHIAGGVPCLAIEMDQLDATNLGGLIYLFEEAVAVGGRLLDVNPFDQPGVEAYKQEMFRLLGKPD